MTGALEPRLATDDDFELRGRLVAGAFLGDTEQTDTEQFRLIDEPERTHLITDEGVAVAAGGALTRELSVPGAQIPAAHVTAVAVAATHRRRGLLTSIMTAQLRSVRDHGTEPLAVLWASEGAIYGRYGYGLASWHSGYDVAVRETSVPGELAPGTRLREAVPRECTERLAEVFDRVRARRPGLSSRPGRWWEYLTADPSSSRRGLSVERAVLYEVDGRPEGYVRYRTRSGRNDTGPDGEVVVTELVAETPAAHEALWRFLLSIDLVRTVRYPFAAVDDPLPYLVTNPHGLGVTAGPGLWVRPVDVPAALAARRYLVPVDAVLEVTDARLPENAGRWRLVGDPASATCTPTDSEPDVTLDVRELGSLYLGGVRLSSLIEAGLVRERTHGASDRLCTAFGWRHAPAAMEVF
ncbi:putative acetyltransferase [Haloactinopolyspora alba]|uniref:Putative acetyltransferase n=1 Tax=Haloactinopolyspora alba TaxID=648780 RepID=A0A2P8E6R8_9ACTN|nr:GNAT family N-acetyltransferase [Haloactinopolyspora alba]PSL05171.1 putative acetyltransferase [Haloactinopolyspora alba]